jgi:hypothetical protein
MDLPARPAVRPDPGNDVHMFSVPSGLFYEMEKNAEGCFQEPEFWKEVRDSARIRKVVTPHR